MRQTDKTLVMYIMFCDDFLFRQDSYKCITEMLEFLLSTSQSHPQAPSVPKSPGPPPAPDPNMLTNAEAEQYVSTSQLYKLASFLRRIVKLLLAIWHEKLFP